MAWTTPRTWAPAYEVTDSDMDIYVSDNLNEVRDGGIAVTGQTAGDVVIASGAQNWTRVVGLTYLSSVLSVPGRIRLSTEETGAGVVSGDIYKNALVLAWAKIASGGGLLDGVNVSTSTDAGDFYRVTFASPLPDNYAVMATPIDTGSSRCAATAFNHTNTQCSIMMDISRNPADMSFTMVAIGGHDD
jgi:hypothetical protein